MIVAIERTKFTYLYKYNQIRVDINQLIDKSTNKLKDMLNNDLNNLIQLFNKALPLFEQDHEIILLEIDKSKINLQDGILISFDSIHCIYPLTKTGLQLLDGKINDDFILEPPVFENAIEALRFSRSMAYRRATSIKLLIHYNLDALLQRSMLSLIESAVEKNLLDKSKPQVFNTFLDHLIAYNKTPSYIPDGNIEHICKIGAVAIKYLDKPEEVFTNGPFYKSSIKYKSKINSHSFLTSYLDFNSIADSDLKSSIEKMVEIISKDYIGIDVFKVSFFFLAFKSFLNQHDNNIELLHNEIEALIANDKQSASFVLAMLGYTFSIESIYEGLHKISNAPLLKSTQSKISAEIEKRKRIEAEIEKKNELEKAAIEQERIRLSQLMQKEETKSEVVEYVAVIADEVVVEAGIEKALEEAAEEVIHIPIENVSEPIVIYENTEKAAVLASDNTKQTDFEEIKSSTESIEPKSTEIEKETLTVQIFKAYLTKEQSKPKQKIWFELLDTYFPSKHDEITLEKLLDKLDSIPEVKDKLLKAKKDRDSIKSFFDSYK
jgi:hypothetical protein